MNSWPAERQAAARGRVDAPEHLEQRGLARPVLPDERVHLARAHVEVDVVERPDAGELHRDVLDLEEGRAGGGCSHHRSIEEAWSDATGCAPGWRLSDDLTQRLAARRTPRIGATARRSLGHEDRSEPPSCLEVLERLVRLFEGPDTLDQVVHGERAVEVQVDRIPDVVGDEAAASPARPAPARRCPRHAPGRVQRSCR